MKTYFLCCLSDRVRFLRYGCRTGDYGCKIAQITHCRTNIHNHPQHTQWHEWRRPVIGVVSGWDFKGEAREIFIIPSKGQLMSTIHDQENCRSLPKECKTLCLVRGSSSSLSQRCGSVAEYAWSSAQIHVSPSIDWMFNSIWKKYVSPGILHFW